MFELTAAFATGREAVPLRGWRVPGAVVATVLQPGAAAGAGRPVTRRGGTVEHQGCSHHPCRSGKSL